MPGDLAENWGDLWNWLVHWQEASTHTGGVLSEYDKDIAHTKSLFFLAKKLQQVIDSNFRFPQQLVLEVRWFQSQLKNIKIRMRTLSNMKQFNFCPLLAKRLHFTLGDQLVNHNNRTSGEKRSRVRTGSINIQQTTFHIKTYWKRRKWQSNFNFSAVCRLCSARRRPYHNHSTKVALKIFLKRF